jgi:hypothetical protein
MGTPTGRIDTISGLPNRGALRHHEPRRTATPIRTAPSNTVWQHRLAQFSIAVAILVTAKLIDWRNGPSPGAERYPLRVSLSPFAEAICAVGWRRSSSSMTPAASSS